MSILLRGSRQKRRAPQPSLREVCLVGMARPTAAWASGDQVSWSGRAYRVEAIQPRVEEGQGNNQRASRYVHLSSLPEG